MGIRGQHGDGRDRCHDRTAVDGAGVVPGRDFRTAYGLLLVPSLLALASLTAARVDFPVPSRLEEGGPTTARAIGFTRAYWLYMVAGACFAAGLMSFEFIAYHLSTTGKVQAQWLPVFLAMSTAFAVVASLVLGRTYDRIGIGAVVGAVVRDGAVFAAGLLWWGLVGAGGAAALGRWLRDAGHAAQGPDRECAA